MAAENTAKAFGGVSPSKRFSEIISQDGGKMTADEIVGQVIERGGLTLCGERR